MTPTTEPISATTTRVDTIDRADAIAVRWWTVLHELHLHDQLPAWAVAALAEYGPLTLQAEEHQRARRGAGRPLAADLLDCEARPL